MNILTNSSAITSIAQLMVEEASKQDTMRCTTVGMPLGTMSSMILGTSVMGSDRLKIGEALKTIHSCLESSGEDINNPVLWQTATPNVFSYGNYKSAASGTGLNQLSMKWVRSFPWSSSFLLQTADSVTYLNNINHVEEGAKVTTLDNGFITTAEIDSFWSLYGVNCYNTAANLVTGSHVFYSRAGRYAAMAGQDFDDGLHVVGKSITYTQPPATNGVGWVAVNGAPPQPLTPFYSRGYHARTSLTGTSTITVGGQYNPAVSAADLATNLYNFDLDLYYGWDEVIMKTNSLAFLPLALDSAEGQLWYRPVNVIPNTPTAMFFYNLGATLLNAAAGSFGNDPNLAMGNRRGIMMMHFSGAYMVNGVRPGTLNEVKQITRLAYAINSFRALANLAILVGV